MSPLLLGVRGAVGRAARRWLGRPRPGEVPVVSAAAAFPEAPAEPVLGPERVAVPGARDLPLWPQAGRAYPDAVIPLPGVTARLVAGGWFCGTNQTLFDPRGRVVAESAGAARLHYPFDSRAFGRRPSGRIAGVATALRAYRRNHYHALVDCLPRLWALGTPALQALGEVQLLYAGPPPTEVERATVAALGLENVRFVEVPADATVEVETYVLIPFLSASFAGVLPEPYLAALREALRPPRPAGRRLYVSRATAARRRVVGEEAVVARLAARGFEAVDPGTMPFAAQVDAFAEAEAVVGPHGAGLTGLLFADRPAVVELHPTPFVVPHFAYLAFSRGMPYRALLGDRPGRNDDVAVDLDALDAALDELGVLGRG